MVKSLRNKTSIFALILLFVSCAKQQQKNDSINSIESKSVAVNAQKQYPKYLKVLKECYGKHFTILSKNTILWRDGDTLTLDDRIPKDCNEAILNADIEDQFRTPYPLGKRIVPKDSCFDPGRIRNEKFFRKMYGVNKQEVITKLDTVWWPTLKGKQILLVNTENGCRDNLQKVADTLSKLPNSMLKYISPSAGTFNYRTIANTNRLSCHSFGIAIDINVKYSHYWLWASDKTSVTYKNSIPYEIVEIFEKHGFIWGGYWYHFDTMHFEFRPELIKFAEYE